MNIQLHQIHSPLTVTGLSFNYGEEVQLVVALLQLQVTEVVEVALESMLMVK
jgi:hypothetical protein